jgi:hypothetical protein
MSADNYIYISRKTKKGYGVWYCVASCVCRHKKHCLQCQKISLIGYGKTIEEAIKIAHEETGFTEYGISVNDLWCK